MLAVGVSFVLVGRHDVEPRIRRVLGGAAVKPFSILSSYVSLFYFSIRRALWRSLR